MIEKQTIIERIEIESTGVMQIRLATIIVENGRELARAWHRTSVAPGSDANVVMAAVNASLSQTGKATVDVKDIARVTALVPIVHSADIVQKFREKG